MKKKHHVKAIRPGIRLKTLEEKMSEQEYQKKGLGTETMRETFQNNEVNSNNQNNNGNSQGGNPKQGK